MWDMYFKVLDEGERVLLKIFACTLIDDINAIDDVSSATWLDFKCYVLR